MAITIFSRYRIIIIVLSGLAAVSAISGNRAQAEERKSRLIVSFYSICCGIDSAAKERLDKFLSRYEKAERVRITKESIRWGKEGEIDYCFKLSNLSSRKQKRLISEIKSLLKESTLVRIEENAPCKVMRKN